MPTQGMPTRSNEAAQSARTPANQDAASRPGKPPVAGVEGAARPGDTYSPPELSLRPTLRTLAEESGIDCRDPLRPETLNARTVGMIPEDLARQCQVVAVSYDPAADRMTVAMANPFDVELVDTLPARIGCAAIVPILASDADIKACHQYFYSRERGLAAIEAANRSAPPLKARVGELIIGEKDDPAQREIVRIGEALLRYAINNKASDISIEPGGDGIRVRMRIDGVYRFIDPPPDLGWHSGLVSWFKTKTDNMDIAETRVPQDGRFRVVYRGKGYDLRVNTLATTNGEMVTLRLLDPANAERSLREIGLSQQNALSVERLLRSPNGIILVTGPTGSGKTTTLYACLNVLRGAEKKIITIEDPVEYNVEGLNQVQINDRIGLTFAAGLEASLRQAPSVILVGEIRNAETAQIAARAALTGHLVLSTLHTNDAASALTRLVDMGVERYLIAETLRGVVAQRLVRTLCDHCAKPGQPDEHKVERLGIKTGANLSGMKEPVGCGSCHDGFRGQTGIHEVLTCTPDISQLIQSGQDADAIRRKARELKMPTMRQDGILKAVAGQIYLDEVESVTAAPK